MFPLTFLDWEFNSWMKCLISCHHYAARAAILVFFVTIKEFCEVPQLELEFWRNLPITSPKLITSLPSPSLAMAQYLFNKQYTLSGSKSSSGNDIQILLLSIFVLFFMCMKVAWHRTNINHNACEQKCMATTESVQNVNLNESLSREAEVSSELHAIVVKVVRHLSITSTKTLKNIVKNKMHNFWLQLSHEVWKGLW